jgi:hypothetical protein
LLKRVDEAQKDCAESQRWRPPPKPMGPHYEGVA